MTKEWFRKTTWGPADESEFEARLKRARAAKRPQYLYLQGQTLLETGDARLFGTAIALAERSVAEFPAHAHTSAAQNLKRQCLRPG
jgi:hypothetical protein